jgi:tetratricopeptide (TPR) repeat protein
LGGAESIVAVGQALRDRDRAVRLIAENGITAVWSRAGSIDQCHRLQAAMRLNRSGQFAEAIAATDEILAENPSFSEASHQRALAQYSLGAVKEAIADSQQSLESNPYHFQAAVGLGQCYLELSDPSTALCCYQWALQIHPYLEFARAQVRRLERELRERLDR